MKTYHPQQVKHSLPRWMTSYLNLQRSALPRLRNTNQGHDYPSGRCSASLRPLSFYLKHASHPTSLTPKLMHPSYTDIIDAVDAAIWQVEWVGYHGRAFGQIEEEPDRVGPRDRSVTSDEGQTTKRQKVDVNTFLWVQRERISAMPLNVSLTAMLTLLKLYAQDFKLTKSSILTSPRMPQFPHLEWMSVLTGVMVNLNHVLSGMHAVSNNNWEVELIGGIQLKYGAAEAVKKVKNSGDWLQVFQVYMKAVILVFPHRKEELEDYTEQVATLFVVVTEANQPIVINYDKAVWTHIGDVQNLLLTDKSEFKDLWLYWLHPLGQGFRDTNSGSTSNHSPRTSYRSNDDCLKFNDGKCTNKASSCKYRHRCAGCRGRHSKKDCGKGGDWAQMPVTLLYLWITVGYPWLVWAQWYQRHCLLGTYHLPVPGVPLKEFENHEAIQMIKMNPELFQVNCSLNIDQFCELLVDHPNQALVDSVCQSLHEGYWPYADMKFGDIKAGYPTTLDMSSKGSMSNEHLDFIQAQVKVEVAAGRYSASFGPTSRDVLLTCPCSAKTTRHILAYQPPIIWRSLIKFNDLEGRCGWNLHGWDKVSWNCAPLFLGRIWRWHRTCNIQIQHQPCLLKLLGPSIVADKADCLSRDRVICQLM